MESKTKFNRSVSLLCWAYNEEDSILEFLEKATQLMTASVEDYEIILIDDGSTDKTYEIAKAFQDKKLRLKISQNEKNLNISISFQRAIQMASKEFLFWQTVDWSYNIGNLREKLEYLHQFDIVQGTRRKAIPQVNIVSKTIEYFIQLFGVKHLTKRSDSVGKAIVSVVNYTLIRLLFKVPISDYQNITFYPTKLIQSFKYESKSSFSSPEGLIKSYWLGKSFKEVEINFTPRSKGIGKGIRLNAIVNSIYDIFRLWFKWLVLGKRVFICNGSVERVR